MASESMRDKIARAAHDAQWEEPFPKAGSIAYSIAMQVADAVLDALMEPTIGMVVNGEDAVAGGSSTGFVAMIRAAKDGA